MLYWQYCHINFWWINALVNNQYLNYFYSLYWPNLAFFSLQTKKWGLRFNCNIYTLNLLICGQVFFIARNSRLCACAPPFSIILRYCALRTRLRKFTHYGLRNNVRMLSSDIKIYDTISYKIYKIVEWL